MNVEPDQEPDHEHEAAPGSRSVIGVLGGGQLGRMLIQEAAARGYRCVVRTNEAPGGPAAQVAHAEFVGPYDDDAVNVAFVNTCTVVTSEFENLPASLLDTLAARVSVRPSSFSLSICQHRRREKEFLAALRVPHAPFVVVRSADELCSALKKMGGQGVLKTAAFGYDGRGQIRLKATPRSTSGPACEASCASAWRELGVDEAVLEGFVSFVQEISVVGARGSDGSWVAFAPGENSHVGGVLDYTIAPARIEPNVALEAGLLARKIADALDHVGTIGVEFFVLSDGSLIVNEMAPRPHNSGHHTIDACTVSQFGLQLQATLGIALDEPGQHCSAIMVNLLGELWATGEPLWSNLEGDPTVRLHLYGKASARPGRKMGHLTVLALPGEHVDAHLARALAIRAGLIA